MTHLEETLRCILLVNSTTGQARMFGADRIRTTVRLAQESYQWCNAADLRQWPKQAIALRTSVAISLDLSGNVAHASPARRANPLESAQTPSPAARLERSMCWRIGGLLANSKGAIGLCRNREFENRGRTAGFSGFRPAMVIRGTRDVKYARALAGLGLCTAHHRNTRGDARHLNARH
jgi:hypothetical protein